MHDSSAQGTALGSKGTALGSKGTALGSKGNALGPKGNALGLCPPQFGAPTVRDTVAHQTTPPRIAALQAANLLPLPSQGDALG